MKFLDSSAGNGSGNSIPSTRLDQLVRQLRLGVLGTVGLYGLFFLLVHLLFYLYREAFSGAGLYLPDSSGPPRLAWWAWCLSLVLPALGCALFIRGQDLRNRERLTRTWDSWRWFDHGVEMVDTDLEYSGRQKDSFARAAALDPDDPYARNNLGTVLWNQGKFEEAVAEYYKAIKLKPDYHKPYSNLGAAYARLGDLDLAVRLYRKALKLDPRDPASHLNLGAALVRMGRTTQAVPHLREFVRLAPGHPRAEEISSQIERLRRYS